MRRTLKRRNSSNRSHRGWASIGLMLTTIILATSCSTPGGGPEGGAPSDAQTQSLAKVQYGRIAPSASSWQQIVGLDESFFSEQGINFELVQIGVAEGMAAVTSGSLDVMFQPCDVIMVAIEAGADVSIIAGVQTDHLGALVVGQTVTGYNDLKGKTIATAVIGDGTSLLVQELLAAHGVQKNDYTLVAAGGTAARLAGLQSGAFQATWLLQPQDLAAVDQKVGTILGRFNEVAPVFQYGCLVANNAWAKQNKKTVVSFLKAWGHSLEWLKDPANKKQAISALDKETGISEQVGEAAYDLMIVKNPDTFPDYGEVSVAGLKASHALLVKAGTTKVVSFDANKYLDMSYLKEAVGKSGTS